MPLAPGGLIGVELGGQVVQRYLGGFTGGTLVLIAMFASGLSLFSGLSWLSVVERIGAWVERMGGLGCAAGWSSWQDRRAGRRVAESAKRWLKPSAAR